MTQHSKPGNAGRRTLMAWMAFAVASPFGLAALGWLIERFTQ